MHGYIEERANNYNLLSIRAYAVTNNICGAPQSSNRYLLAACIVMSVVHFLETLLVFIGDW